MTDEETDTTREMGLFALTLPACPHEVLPSRGPHVGVVGGLPEERTLSPRGAEMEGTSWLLPAA